MIKFFRDKTVKKRIFIGLAVVIIPSFVISGLLLSRDEAKSPGSLGRIGGKTISFQKYLSSYQAVNRQLSLTYGQEAAQMSRYMNLKGEAWDRLLLLDYAKSSNLKASDKEVVSWIAQQPAFSSKNGFDDRFYQMFVTEHLRMTPRAFEEEMRDTLTLQKIREKLRARVSVSDEELKELYDRENGRKEITAGFIPSAPEKAGITPPTEEELKQLYPILQREFMEPGKIKVRFIFVPREKSVALKPAMDETALDIDALAKKYSLEVIETGFFSPNDAVLEIGPVKEVLEAAFKTEKGAETSWIHVDKGSYKLKVTEIQEAQAQSFEQAKDKLMAIYMEQLASQAAAAKFEKIKEELKTGDFEKLLKDAGAEVKSPAAFGFEPRALEIAKNLKTGEVSEPFPVPNGAAVIKVLNQTTADSAKFEEDKKEFKETVLDRKTSEEFKSLLENLRKTRLQVNLESMRKIFPDEAGAGLRQ